MKRILQGVLAWLCVALVAADGSAQQKLLAVEDLYRFASLRQIVAAPDGKSAIGIRAWIDPETKVERFSLWKLPGENETPFALEMGEPDARLAFFSPDGKWIVLLSTRSRPKGWKQTPTVPPESDAATDIWLMPVAGGAAIPLAGPDKPYGRVFNDGFYGRVAFSPDGRKLIFVADDGADPRTREEIENDVLIVRPDQGEGYTGYGTAQVWIAHLDAKPGQQAAREIERLTKDDVWYGDPQWSPDGKTIVAHANKTKDREAVRYSINKNFDIWAIEVASGKQTQLSNGPGPDVSPRLSPDGKRLVYLSVPRKGSHRDVFNVIVADMDKAGSKSSFLFHNDADNKPVPTFPLPDDCWQDNGGIYFRADYRTRSRVVRLNIKSGVHEAEDESPKPADRFQARLADNPWLRDRRLAKQEVIHWQNEDWNIDGVVTVPPVGRAPYPLVIYPHGGPHSRSVVGFNFTTQVLAAHGYVVLEPNFRGSHGYGQKFIDADRGDFGGGDMRDILAGADLLIKKGLVDKDRQFVYGVSYGGYMTTWLVGQTNRFKAAVAQNPVTDLNMMWGLSDIQSWTEWEFRGYPWQVPAAMAKHSPLTHVAKVKTPTLLLQSRDDRRCPWPMAKAYHQALVTLEVPTRLVFYPGEGHGIKQPRHREDVLRRVLGWFAKHDPSRASSEAK